MNIIIHIFGVIALVQVITHFISGGGRAARSGEALVLTVPVSIAYLAWLIF